MRQALRRQQLGDAEIEQLRRAVVGDEDIRGLDVPVHHQIAVRVLHRGADLNEQLEAFANEQGAAVAIAVDGFAVDVLHHQIRRAVLEIAAVDQARDRRVIERREDVPLAVQSAAQPRMQRRVLQHLDGDGLLILRVIALAAVHGAHAAVPENRHHAIRADARADQPVLMILQQRLGGFADGVQQRVLAPAASDASRDSTDERRSVSSPQASSKCAARSRGADVDHLLEQRLNLLPAGARNHADRSPPISLSSQARAKPNIAMHGRGRRADRSGDLRRRSGRRNSATR